MYTKGEWKAEIGYTNIWITANVYPSGKKHSTVAEIPTSNDNAEANAHLIAASPDMYEELLWADEAICSLCKEINPQHATCTKCDEHESRLKALAKAKGKQ